MSKRRYRNIRRVVGCAVAITMCTTFTASIAEAAPGPESRPTIVGLGTLPGGTYSSATLINDRGIVVGVSYAADGRRVPVLWDAQGQILPLDLLPGDTYGGASAINNQGTIAGTSYTDPGQVHAVRWNIQGQVTQLDNLPGSSSASPSAMNEAGVIVGTAGLADGSSHAVRWDPDGRITDLGTWPGDVSSQADMINDEGTVIGVSVSSDGTRRTVVRWDNQGGITQLDLQQAAAINNNGTVAGDVHAGPFGSHAARWSPHEQVTDLGVAPGDLLSQASGLNDAGTIIGLSRNFRTGRVVEWDQAGTITVLDTLGPFDLPKDINNAGIAVGNSNSFVRPIRAVRWDRAGRVTDLGTLGGTSSRAGAINVAGVAVGEAATSDGHTHAVLWPLN